MTQLSARALAVFLESECRQHGAVALGTAIHALREFNVPDHRIRTALALALNSDRLQLGEHDNTGRPMLIAKEPRP